MDVRVGPYIRLSAEELILSNFRAGEGSWESLGEQSGQTSQSSRRSTLNIHWKVWCWSWSSSTLATWCKGPAHWKRPWCWERLRVEGEEGDRGWDGWMASLAQWTRVWANSREAWHAAVHGVTESQTWLSDSTTTPNVTKSKLYQAGFGEPVCGTFLRYSDVQTSLKSLKMPLTEMFNTKVSLDVGYCGLSSLEMKAELVADSSRALAGP